MKRILSAAWHPGSANSIAPVIKKLSREEEIDVCCAGHEFTKKIFKECLVPLKNIGELSVRNISMEYTENVVNVVYKILKINNS